MRLDKDRNGHHAEHLLQVLGLLATTVLRAYWILQTAKGVLAKMRADPDPHQINP